MSVIWSGITEQGAVVPVQVDETGKVIATASVPDQYVLRSGDTMTGPLVLPGDPQSATEAATKQYVDSALAPNTPLAYGWFSGIDSLVGAYNINSFRYLNVGDYAFYFENIPPSDNYCVVCNATSGNANALWTDRNVLQFTISMRDPFQGGAAVNSSVSFVVYWSPNVVKMDNPE